MERWERSDTSQIYGRDLHLTESERDLTPDEEMGEI
jgi:hypothetical protein